MNFADALSKLSADHPPYEPTPCSTPCEPGCCSVMLPDVNVTAAERAGSKILAELGNEWVDFGLFDNCREYGLTYTTPTWQFCIYEHRNSDELCLQGCPIDAVEPYGPYGGITDKYDVLVSLSHGSYDAMAALLVAALRFVKDQPDATRKQVKLALAYCGGAR